MHFVILAFQNGILLWEHYEDFNHIAQARSICNPTCKETTCCSKTCVKFALGNCIYTSYGRSKVSENLLFTAALVNICFGPDVFPPYELNAHDNKQSYTFL